MIYYEKTSKIKMWCLITSVFWKREAMVLQEALFFLTEDMVILNTREEERERERE